MIPLQDEIRSHRTPFVNYAILAINVAVFVATGILGLADFEAFTRANGLIPAQVFQGFDFDVATDFLTSMFMHGSLLHLAANMLYLWIFGDNVEDAMGHAGYLLFYLLGGLLASAMHVFTNPLSTVPTVGASGAIAAVLGGYAILYPGSRVRTLIPLGFFIRIAVLPAALVLGLWFVFELLRGLYALGMPPDMGGVAFWAHIGGFVAGMVLAKFFAKPRDTYGGSNY